MENMDRRSFLKSAALLGSSAAVAGVTGLSTAVAQETSTKESDAKSDSLEQVDKSAGAEKKYSFETPPEPVSDEEIVETFEAEVIVVGAGMSGLVTANSAMEAGADVILFSASTKTTARGGSNNAIYSKAMERAGLPKVDPWYLQKEIYSNYAAVDQKKWAKYYQNSEEATNWLIDIMEGAGYYTVLEQPNFITEGNLYSQAVCSHSWVSDPLSDQVSLCQQFVVDELAKRLIDNGVQVDYEMTGYQLVREDDNTGRVSAIVARRQSDGKYVKYVGTKAVVLATGDFSTNKELMEKYAPEFAGCVTDERYNEPVDYDIGLVPGGLYPGEGQVMGLWVGAAWQKTLPNCPMFQNRTVGAAQNRYQNFLGLLVDRDGERFMNEDASRVLGPLVQAMQAGGVSVAIWDIDWFDKFTWYNGAYSWEAREETARSAEEMIATWDKNVEDGKAFKADTLEELIEAAGLPESTLDTIKRYNEMCENGEDTEFCKDAKFLIPIKTPPFYAQRGETPKNELSTIFGGLRTNGNMQVCDEDDNAIPGLYNVGTMIGDLWAGRYTFNLQGGNYGMACLTLGYVTGKYIAENE